MHALHAVVQADRGWRATGDAGTIVTCQGADLFGRDAAHGSGAFGRPLQGALTQQVPAQRVLRQVIVIQPVVRNQLVHQRERQCTVGARQQGDVFVALVGGFAFARIDADQLGAGALGLLRVVPEVQVAGDRVAAPDQDQFRFGKKFNAHAELAAQRLCQRLGAGAGADGAVEQGSAQLVKEARCRALALHQAHGAAVAVGQDGLGSIGACSSDGGKAACDVGECHVPAHALELP